MARRSSAGVSSQAVALGELAERLGGTLHGDPDRRVYGIAGIDEATSDQLTFCHRALYRAGLASTAAAAVILGEAMELPAGCRADLAVIRVADPYLATARAISILSPGRRREAGVHPSAVVDESATLAGGVHVGAAAVIGARARIGARSAIGAGTVIGEGAVVGEDCEVHANVTVYDGVEIGDRVVVHAGVVLGADGFGYARDGRRHVKVPQVGGLVVEDDVEIGANAAIDRATVGVTRVGRGTKIDNLVQIGHNCDIGPDCILCGQVGLGGTTRLGAGVVLGGQAGVSGHLEIGSGARVAAQTGVINDVAPGETVAGYPHLEAGRWRRAIAVFRRLPELLRRLRRLESAVGVPPGEEE